MEKVENKLTEEELTKVQEQQNKLTALISQIGLAEAQKHALLHEIASVNQVIEETKKQLEDKYGSINVDLETGAYTEISEDESNKED